MSYCNSYNQDSSMYGLQGTSRRDLDEASRKDMDYCRDKMSCIPPYNYMLVSGSGTNVKCKCITKEQADRAVDGGIVIRPDGGRYNRASRGGYGNIIRQGGISGLGETAAQERARHKKNIAKCDASCASNPIAAICRAEGRTVKADHCDIDTGINEYGCSCGKPIVTGSGVMTTSSNRSYGGYGNIIRSQGVGGLNESFLESLGSLGNLAIIGLAIYGGFCLAKKL